MPSDTVQKFIDGLRQSEQSHDPGPVAALFADDAELANLTHTRKGAAGARQFWDEYLKAFKAVKSDFFAVNEAAGFAVLEWTSTGELPTGAPITYTGVSVLETAGGRVTRFRTYYDSAAFVAPEAGRRLTYRDAPRPCRLTPTGIKTRSSTRSTSGPSTTRTATASVTSKG